MRDDYNSLKEEFYRLKKDFKINNSGKNNIENNVNSFDTYSWSSLGDVSKYAKRGDFGILVETAKFLDEKMREDGVDIEEEKYLRVISRDLDKASKIALSYMKENKENITPEKVEEIENLLNYSEDFKLRLPHKMSRIEKVLSVFSVSAIAVSVIMNSNRLTGNVVLMSNFNTFSILSATLFVLGIIGLFVSIKK